MKIQPSHSNVLNSYLLAEGANLEEKPNGQNMYSFSTGLVVSVYETGSINIQGQGLDSELKKKIDNLIDIIKAP